MKKVVYTAIIGKYDPLREIPERFRRGWELRCFTDQDLKADGWEIIEVCPVGMPKVALARKIKILSHYYLDDADIFLWVDGSLQIVGDLNRFMDRFAREEFVLFRHPRRSCVYEEIQACRRKAKAAPGPLKRQEAAYRDMGYPVNEGLMMTGFLFRRKTPWVERLNEEWWKLTALFGTWRDQLTLPLACRQIGWGPKILDYPLAGAYFRQKAFHKGIAAVGN